MNNEIKKAPKSKKLGAPVSDCSFVAVLPQVRRKALPTDGRKIRHRDEPDFSMTIGPDLASGFGQTLNLVEIVAVQLPCFDLESVRPWPRKGPTSPTAQILRDMVSDHFPLLLQVHKGVLLKWVGDHRNKRLLLLIKFYDSKL